MEIIPTFLRIFIGAFTSMTFCSVLAEEPQPHPGFGNPPIIRSGGAPLAGRCSPIDLHLQRNAQGGGRAKDILIVTLSISLTAMTVCIFACAAYWYWQYMKRKALPKRREATGNVDAEMGQGIGESPRRFTYDQLCAATENFGQHAKLGEGGFGSVYRAVLAETNEIVAVKRMTSRRSEQHMDDYFSEVGIISRLRQQNLVQLLGWCHDTADELLVVYEYLANGSLDRHLFGRDKEKGLLDWDRRYAVAGGLASALLYLHEEWEQRVVHRDVKSSNVMLDSRFGAKLGDFGLARLMEHHSLPRTTVVAGTFGYLAPECVLTGKMCVQSDVFAFGAVCLEIACGRPAVDRSLEEDRIRLVDWVWNLYAKGRLLEAADGSLLGRFNVEEMERLMVVGLACSHLDPAARPTIRKVVQILKCEEPLPAIPSDAAMAVYAPLP